jgi:crotonobetainyl-CoA:carnitine CoA-transferase CaiB-like acyl-CoA transferase
MKALEGVTVIALEHAVAAPFASRQLADQGARVIKIERPDGGDFARSYDQRARGQSSHFIWLNRSKESVCLDLKSEKGKETLRELLKHSDVFIQNLGPGVCESLGFGPDKISAISPRCITCSISGYGSNGPFTERKAYDLLIQAESGLLSITGTEESACKVGVSIADIAAGMYAVTNILNALILRQKGGKPQHIEVSMLEALAEWMGFPLYYCLDNQTPPARSGVAHATIFPYGPYTTKGGEILLIAIQQDREWQVFCEQVLRDEQLARESSFATNPQRNAARKTLQPTISSRVLNLSVDEAIMRLQKAKIAFAQLKSVPEVWRHPQLLARDRFAPVDTPAGTMSALLPPGMNLDSVRMDRVPALGQDTDKVLAWLKEVSW